MSQFIHRKNCVMLTVYLSPVGTVQWSQGRLRAPPSKASKPSASQFPSFSLLLCWTSGVGRDMSATAPSLFSHPPFFDHPLELAREVRAVQRIRWGYTGGIHRG